MLRTTHGSHRTAGWATPQKPRTGPRVVRLGRPANDNARQPGPRARLLLLGGIALALALVALVLLASS